MPEIASPTRGPQVVPAYVDALEAGAADKAALFARWIDADASGALVDIGCGPGGVAARLAAARPACSVFGIDAQPAMVALARDRYGGRSNLVFGQGFADRLQGSGNRVCLLSSVLHELAAQGGLPVVERVLQCAAASLQRGGRLIVRDFVRPGDAARPVRMRHARHDIRRGRGFDDFATAASFAVRFDGHRGEPDALSYDTDLEGAYEFALRKDCGDAWEAELAQRYAFWSESDCIRLVHGAGLRILHLEVRNDHWIVEHRVQGRLGLRDALTGQPLALPVVKIVVVAERR